MAKKRKLSAQDSIPYREMARDGICRVRNGLYSKTVQFFDINYRLAQQEDREAIFAGWCGFLNYFDSAVHVEVTFANRRGGMREYEGAVEIAPRHDAFDAERAEYAGMLREQLAKGNNGILRSKYVTFATGAKDISEARPRLERIEADIRNNFKAIGVRSVPLDGAGRLKLLYEEFHPGAAGPFPFSYRDMGAGRSTKDYVAPESFRFGDGRGFSIGKHRCAASYLQLSAPEISDGMLADFLDLDLDLTVSLHLSPIGQAEAVRLVKGKVSDIDRMKIEEQKRAVRAGYDMDILPSDLRTFGDDAKRLLGDLQSRNERLFTATAIFINKAESERELADAVYQTAGVALKHNCRLERLSYMQEDGLMSVLPLGENRVPVGRRLTTAAAAAFVPFTAEELFMPGQSVYYGLNAVSNNMIMADRKKLKNPNGLILGTPGSGKSFSAKREMANAFFVTDDDIIVCDPEAEYRPLVQALGGQVIRISPASRDYVNPMDINMNYADGDSPLGVKADFILSLCELITGSRDGIEAQERSVIDRCLPAVYERYFSDPRPENMPVLGDLYEHLMRQPEEQARRISTALEIYVSGSLNVFNHRTNVELGSRIVCFDIKDLGKQLKKIGMLVIQDQVWNRVSANREGRKSTRYYIDEMHLLLKEEQTAAYTAEIWKRFRKWGGIPTGLTQNIKDLLASREIENIFENSDFILMLNQAAGDREILAEHLSISPKQLSYVTNSGEGEGLLFFGNTIIPFIDRFPRDLKLYALMTTKPEEAGMRGGKEAGTAGGGRTGQSRDGGR